MAAAKGKEIKVKAKLEVWELCPAKTLKIIQGKEYKLKFKPVEVAGSVELANDDYKDLTPANFQDFFKNTMRRELAIFHVRAEQELTKVDKAKNDRDKAKCTQNLKQVLENTAKDIHKAAAKIFKEMQESAGKATKSAELPKGADKNLKGVEKSIAGMQDDTKSLADAAVEAQRALSEQPVLTKQEKTKHLKPLLDLIMKVEKSQKELLADLQKSAGMTRDIDQKSADSQAKKLLKLGKTMDEATKKFVAHARSTKKDSADLIAKLAAREFTSPEAVRDAVSNLYKPPSLEQLEEAYNDFADDAKKLKKAA